MPVSPQQLPPFTILWGWRLYCGALTALLAFGGIMKVFFPERLGQGFDAFALTILIPIWTAGLAGLILLLIGWVRYPAYHRELEIGLPRRPDGNFFGPLTRWLACVFCLLFWIACFVVYHDQKAGPWLARALLLYCVSVLFGFVVYLSWFYRRDRHHATTTYLVFLNPLFAFCLIPVTWPLLFVLNWVVWHMMRQEALQQLQDSL